MVVIYVPLNADNKHIAEQQRLYVDKLVKDGWKNLGIVRLKDFLGTEIEVIVFENNKADEELDYVNVKIVDSNLHGMLDPDIIEAIVKKHPMMKNRKIIVDKRRDIDGFIKIRISDGEKGSGSGSLGREAVHTILWAIFTPDKFHVIVKDQLE